MKPSHLEPAQLPPAGIEGLRPEWSRLVTVPTTDSVGRTWHILDNQVEHPRITLLCVHGNPSWSYLWRTLLEYAPSDVRVIAVDQLDMGFSERTGRVRRLQTRVDDLSELTAELGIDGPVVTVAHDWGGPISLGWAIRHLDQLTGVILLNTAVSQPEGSAVPTLIRIARSPLVLAPLTVLTGGFITGALAMSKPQPAAGIRKGFHAPYQSAKRREAIGEFVKDIPLKPSHPSADALDVVAKGLDVLADVPALLLWGPRDKVFSDLYLHDLEARLPHADVHRFGGASHFVSEDADVVTPIFDWLDSNRASRTDGLVDGAVVEVSAEPAAERPAVVEMGGGKTVTFGDLRDRVDQTAVGLLKAGVEPGDRVALMIPPGVDLSVALYGCWRMGAVAVLVDAGLGPKGMSGALAAANPDHFIGVTKALVASRILGWPGRRFSVRPLGIFKRLLRVVTSLDELAEAEGVSPSLPASSDQAFLVFTSGSTGPSKGVKYTFGQAHAGRTLIIEKYKITSSDCLVAAFAPFAVYGPSMGVTSIVPDMDVTAPGTLTAVALGDAVVAGSATLVFASPAALGNVIKTSGALTEAHKGAFSNVRVLLSAGAPIRPSMLRSASDLFPNASAHTPYGMTECLPVAEISLTDIEGVSGGDGACVGEPLDGIDVQIDALDHFGIASGQLSHAPGVLGEVVVRANHARSGYERLWHTTHLASQPKGSHRTGDVGHLDAQGRLWIGGRMGDVITTAHGVVLPVRIEQAIEGLPGSDMVAVVGVGPVGTQQVVAVIQTPTVRRPALADLDHHSNARSVAGVDLAAVLLVPELPVDRRHNSKMDRPRVAAWATAALSGGRIPKL